MDSELVKIAEKHYEGQSRNIARIGMDSDIQQFWQRWRQYD